MSQLKILPVLCTPEEDFFIKWVEWLKPIHKLTKREQEVFAAFLRNRHELSLSITDPNLLEEIYLNEANRDKIRESLGMSAPQMNGILTKLKEARVIKPHYKMNGKIDYYEISPSFIPPYTKGEPFKLMLLFGDATKNSTEQSS